MPFRSSILARAEGRLASLPDSLDTLGLSMGLCLTQTWKKMLCLPDPTGYFIRFPQYFAAR